LRIFRLQKGIERKNILKIEKWMDERRMDIIRMEKRRMNGRWKNKWKREE
jgi:hypothetical protein